MTRIHDISLTISSELLVWPGDPAIEVVPRLQMSQGDSANVSELRIGTHTGTHVDPPVHFIPGAAGIDAIEPDVLVGPAVVADLRRWSGPVGSAELDGLDLPGGTERLLLRTANSERWRSAPPYTFPDEYAHIGEDGAGWLIDRGIRLVGVDFLSVERKGAEGHPVHVALLGAGVVIVEGLDLGAVEPGSYTLVCLPLKIAGGDGGPARALLMKE